MDMEGVPVHMRISSGMKDKKKEIGGGHFLVTIEVDERVTPVLVGLNGVLRMGHINVEVYAGGIDKAIQAKKDMEEEGRIEQEDLAIEARKIEEMGLNIVEETQEETGGKIPGDDIQDVDG